ncbi:phage shock envelope stress response protein PspM [Mycobacterium sp. Lab-001]|uniref:phage shock envelope stress response protein PspM n=1 Tax=Mycobacterium sp. Lab-001 TaxID=3410136 RepID=UPI003D174B2F
MTVKSTQRGPWRALLQRGLGIAEELSEVLARRLGGAVDPRARLVRRRRRALRWGLIFSAGCLFWAVVTALLAAWGWFALLLEVTGAIAVVQSIPATLLLLRYRWLRSEPLPPGQSAGARRLPPPGSAARPAMYALGASERGFHSLVGVLERGALLPPTEIDDLTSAADRASTAMAATAAEVVSMERAARHSESSRPHLVATINVFTAQLAAGVRQYNEIVTAAAQLVSSANASGEASAGPRQRYRAELAQATDRLVGWAQAFDELGGLPRS